MLWGWGGGAGPQAGHCKAMGLSTHPGRSWGCVGLLPRSWHWGAFPVGIECIFASSIFEGSLSTGSCSACCALLISILIFLR